MHLNHRDSPGNCASFSKSPKIRLADTINTSPLSRRGGRVAEGGGLLNRYRVKSSIGGSNPPLSARIEETLKFSLRAHTSQEKGRRATRHRDASPIILKSEVMVKVDLHESL